MKKILLTLLISTSLIGTSQALTFVNSNSSNNNSETNPSFSSEQIVKLPYDVPLNHFHIADVMDINDDGIDDVLLLPEIYPNGQLSAEIREKVKVREENGIWYLTSEEANTLKPSRSVVLLSSNKGYIAIPLPDSSKSRHSFAGKFILSGDKKYIYLGINDESAVGHDLTGNLGLSVLYEIEIDSSKIKIIKETLADYETSPASIETIDLNCDGQVEILENNFGSFLKKRLYSRSIYIDLDGDITGQNYSLSGLTTNNAFNELEFFDVDQNGVLDVIVAAEVWINDDGNSSNKQPGSYILFNPVEFDNKESNQSIRYFPEPANGRAHAAMSIAVTIQDGTPYFFEQSTKWGVFDWNKFKLYQYDKNNHKIVDVTKLLKGDFSIGDDTHASLYTMDVDFDGDLEIGFKKTTSSAEYFDWNGNEFTLKQFNQTNTSEQHSTYLLRDINNQCVMSLDILDVNTDSGVAKISSCQSLTSEKLVSLEADIQFNQTLSCKDIAKKI
jgi:hypothetical protein